MTGVERIDPELARRIRVVILDADGVLTDGGIYVADGEDEPFGLRRFHVHDGVGIIMLQRAGITVAIVSGKPSRAVRARATELGIEEVHQVDPYDKLPTVDAILTRADAHWDETAFVGDDIADLPVLGEVALAATVPGAAGEVRDAAAWTSRTPGGAGAVREFAEALLRARDEWTPRVEAYVEECRARWRAGRDG
ncbi:MAG: KdsC family phosphatase [Gemmatimonadota bacterium]